MRNTLETRLGVFFALALVVVVILMELVGTFDYFKRGIRVHALFGTVRELKEGDPVRLAGVDIGRVETIRIADTSAQVEVILKLNADDARAVRTDSVASVQFAGLMGQNYVSISFGSASGAPVMDGTTIQTYEQPDLGTLMAKLENVATGVENLTKSLSGDDIQNLLGPFTDFLKENQPRLSAILENARTISTQVAEGDGTVGRLIMEDALHEAALVAVTNLTTTADEIQRLLDDAQGLVADIRGGQGTVGRLVTDEALYTETSMAMTNLRQVLEKINQGQGVAGKLVNDDTFYQNVKMSLQKLDKAAESLEDQGPVSVLGIAVGSLF